MSTWIIIGSDLDAWHLYASEALLMLEAVSAHIEWILNRNIIEKYLRGELQELISFSNFWIFPFFIHWKYLKFRVFLLLCLYFFLNINFLCYFNTIPDYSKISNSNILLTFLQRNFYNNMFNLEMLIVFVVLLFSCSVIGRFSLLMLAGSKLKDRVIKYSCS